jgi:hypothetical protein
MRVGDLQDLDTALPWVDLKGSKTEAARRSLPLHSGATSIYLRRATKDRDGRGKSAEDYLLDELRTPPEGSAMERGQPITKLYSRLLAKLGIGEKEDGARQGNVDLHSLRRRWVTQAEQAGHPENLIASCVGHQRPGMTFGRYSSGPLLEQLRVVVESVSCRNKTMVQRQRCACRTRFTPRRSSSPLLRSLEHALAPAPSVGGGSSSSPHRVRDLAAPSRALAALVAAPLVVHRTRASSRPRHAAL